MAGAVKEITQTATKTVATFREALQDMPVPELRSIKVSLDALTTELRLRDATQTTNLEALREELRLRDATQTKNLDALREGLRLRTDSLKEELRNRNDSLQMEMRTGFKRIDRTIGTQIEVRERLASLEARLPRTQ